MPRITSGVSPTPRTQLAVTSRGLISETFHPGTQGTASIPTTNAASGTLVVGLLGLRAGDVVTNCVTWITTVGVSLTFAKLGLFDSSGNFLAATGSVSATFNATANSYKVVPLTSPYTVTADGGYYVGFLQWGSGATGAALHQTTSGSTGIGTQIGSGARTGAQVLAQTDISGNVTLADSNVAYWFAVS